MAFRLSENVTVLKQEVWRTAIFGTLTWLVYGVFEFAMSYWSHASLLVLNWQWKLLALLLGSYALLGCLLGAAIGTILPFTKHDTSRDNSGKRNQTAVALTLVLAFLLNLLRVWPLPRREYIASIVALSLAAAFIAALASRKWLARTGFLADPWFLTALLLSSPWVSFESLARRSEFQRTAVSLLLIGCLLAAAVFWQRRRHQSVITQWIVLAAAMAIGCAAVAVRQFPGLDTAHAGTLAPGRCNVVLITMDTVRADHVSLYGYKRDTTPRLREFSREATLYDRMVATAAMTLPAHASIFTGFYPSWHGAYLAPPSYPIGHPLSGDHPTLAELLQRGGYQTAAVVANWAYLSPQMGFSRGFDAYDSHRPVQIADSELPFYMSSAVREMLSLAMDTNDFDARVLRAEDVNRRAQDWLSQAGKRGPFFLFLNYMDAHAPYIPESPFDDDFPGKDKHFTPWTDYEKVRRGVLAGSHRLTAREQQHIVSQYDGAIAYMDAQIGELLDRLRALRLYDNTLIIITSDHGEAFGEHNLMEHATGFLYENQVHVPMLIKFPGQHHAEESHTLASEVDLLPTILDVAAIPSPKIQGRTLRSPRTDTSEPVYSEDQAFGYLDVYPRFRGVRRAIFAGPWKLLTWSAGPPELYDLSADPREMHNLYRPDAPQAEELLSRINAWTAAMPRRSKPGTPVNQPNIERLKSLGYIQ